MDITTVFEAAARHGEESEPDHEVGDLQDVLAAAWELMSSEQRLELMQSEVVVALLTEWGA